MIIIDKEASPAPALELEAIPAIGAEATATVADAEPAAIPAPAEPAATVDPDANDAPTLLSVVKDAIDKGAKVAPASSAEPSEEEAAAAAAAAEAEAAENVAEADVPFHEHPRWKAVIAERDSLKADAGQYQQIQTFMEANNLQPDEVAEGYEIMALIKRGDNASIQKALEWFEPRVSYLKQQLGQELPDDLQEKVDAGQLDEDDAAEMARLRATTARSEQQTEAQREQFAANQAAADAQANSVKMATAVQAWEDRTKASDPDYSKKARMVEAEVLAEVQRTGKSPATPEEAEALVARAYGTVTEQFKALVPVPKAIVPSPASIAAKTTGAPKTLEEAIRGAVNQ